MIRIALASTNKAKMTAVETFCRRHFGEFELTPFAVESGVDETPNTDESAIKGCRNRVLGILSTNSDFDYIVSMEGMVRQVLPLGWFLCGWTMILDVKNKTEAFGCSGMVQIPKSITEQMSKSKKLSQIVLETYPLLKASELEEIGTNGVITSGVYCRSDEFVDSLKCAYGTLPLKRQSTYQENIHENNSIA